MKPDFDIDVMQLDGNEPGPFFRACLDTLADMGPITHRVRLLGSLEWSSQTTRLLWGDTKVQPLFVLRGADVDWTDVYCAEVSNP